MTTKGCIRGCGIAASGVAFLFVLTIALIIRGCMNEHDRPGGHGDVTFGISPRGDKLVFNAVGDGGRDLYVLDLNSLAVERLAATPDYEVAPSFSPDGKSVVYAAGKPGDRADHLFVRRLDRNEIKQLTAEDANDSAPEFSPDGLHIAFTRDKTYNWGGLAARWGGRCSALRHRRRMGLVSVRSRRTTGLRTIPTTRPTARPFSSGRRTVSTRWLLMARNHRVGSAVEKQESQSSHPTVNPSRW